MENIPFCGSKAVPEAQWDHGRGSSEGRQFLPLKSATCIDCFSLLYGGTGLIQTCVHLSANLVGLSWIFMALSQWKMIFQGSLHHIYFFKKKTYLGARGSFIATTTVKSATYNATARCDLNSSAPASEQENNAVYSNEGNIFQISVIRRKKKADRMMVSFRRGVNCFTRSLHVWFSHSFKINSWIIDLEPLFRNTTPLRKALVLHLDLLKDSWSTALALDVKQGVQCITVSNLCCIHGTVHHF